MTTSVLFAFFGLFFLGLPILFIILAPILVILVGMWKVFVKAGHPGWGCVIPIYNLYCLVKIAGKPGWWFLLHFVPLVNIVIAVLVALGISRNFGKGDLFALGLFFLPFIFYPILGFGGATYGPTMPPVVSG
jgi:hypothetical protein